MITIDNFDVGGYIMELRNLITFIHVAELGSFTKAAEQLDYSQSTVSFQIKQLEDELGCLLFERINHTITLTERGKELVSYAHQVRALTEEFKENLEEEKKCSGHIHLVTPDSLCDAMITRNYIDFHKRYPDISIKFTTADTSVMFDMLETITRRMSLSLLIVTRIIKTMLSQKKNRCLCTLWQTQNQNLQERKIYL